MVFSSNIFLFAYLPLVLLGYYLIKCINTKLRNAWLLIMSLLFYIWGEPYNIVIIVASILINYISGLAINYFANENTKLKGIMLASCIMANLGLLFWYKYLDFSISTFNYLFSIQMPLQNILLPIGISFFTFQGLSYIIDLYWGKVAVQKNPFKIALYISLFPQLIAGPIVRYRDVAAQIESRAESVEMFYSGVQRFIVGLGKKVLIANNTAVVVDQVFALPCNEISLSTAWLAILCYTVQIYFDFSGYSDMAIGLGRMFGFDFLENFNYPYISRTITEFWRRWHISLSSFFRDYVYIPLGGNRQGNVYRNLLIVFAVTGLWHGAAWNFIIWGLWHGFFIIIERILNIRTQPVNNPVQIFIAHVYTLLVVILGWVFFRAENLTYAIEYIKVLFGIMQPQNVGFSVWYYLNKDLMMILCIAIVAATPLLSYFAKCIENAKCSGMKYYLAAFRMVAITLLFLVSLLFVLSSSYNPFIYFRF